MVALTFLPANIIYAGNSSQKEAIMSIDELKPGMKGFGKTVFSGTKIETFDVEILGVLKNYDAKRDLILVKCSNDVVDKTGIISGMSGSPIYINGKIIGALSYAWAFSKDAIAGVTPIKEMLKLLDIDSPQNRTNRNVAVLSPTHRLTKSNTDREIKLAPIKTPLMVSGFDSNVFNIMGSEIDMLGMTPIQSGSIVDSTIVDSNELEPGSAIGVQLIRGDMSATAVGTVTYKRGKQILAFGHPFLQMGNLDMPMSGAYVHTILSNLSLSSKMASATKVLGRINQDRKAAISGIMGEYSEMISCHAEIDGSQKIEYDFEIVHNKLFTPNLCQMAFLSAILSTEKQAGELFVKLGLKIFADELDSPIILEDIYYDSNTGWYPVSQIMSPIRELLDNRFKEVHIKRIEFKAQLIDEPKVALIENLRVNRNSVSPGETIDVSVKLRPYLDKPFEKSISFKVPDSVKPGSKILVTACSSNQSSRLNSVRAAGKYKPANFNQLIELIKEVEPNNDLIIHVLLPGTGVTYKGEQFHELPPSILSVMTQPNYSGTEPLATEKVFHLQTDWVINGGQSILINID